MGILYVRKTHCGPHVAEVEAGGLLKGLGCIEARPHLSAHGAAKDHKVSGSVNRWKKTQGPTSRSEARNKWQGVVQAASRLPGSSGGGRS